MSDNNLGSTSGMIVENIATGAMTSLWIGLLLLRASGLCPQQLSEQLRPADLEWILGIVLVALFYVIGSLINDFTSNFKLFNDLDQRKRSNTIKQELELWGESKITDPKDVYHLMRFYVYSKSPEVKGNLDYLRRLTRLNRNSILNFASLAVALVPWGPNPIFASRFRVGLMAWIAAILLCAAAVYVWQRQAQRFYEAVSNAYRALVGM